jgi:hypothetical protein
MDLGSRLKELGGEFEVIVTPQRAGAAGGGEAGGASGPAERSRSTNLLNSWHERFQSNLFAGRKFERKHC